MSFHTASVDSGLSSSAVAAVDGNDCLVKLHSAEIGQERDLYQRPLRACKSRLTHGMSMNLDYGRKAVPSCVHPNNVGASQETRLSWIVDPRDQRRKPRIFAEALPARIEA